MTSFVPEAGNTLSLRRALGNYPTGVTVITTDSVIGPLGITANSFSSVSLDPPLVLWSPARASLRFDAFAKAQYFAIHILGEDQKHVCDQFSRQGHDFGDLDYSLNQHGVPLLGEFVTRLECSLAAQHDGGDHLIIVGRVEHVATRDKPALVFARGEYRALTKSER